MVTIAITPVRATARLGFPVAASTVANGPSPLNNRSAASACKIRGAPRKEASADESVAERTPASISQGTLATRPIPS